MKSVVLLVSAAALLAVDAPGTPTGGAGGAGAEQRAAPRQSVILWGTRLSDGMYGIQACTRDGRRCVPRARVCLERRYRGGWRSVRCVVTSEKSRRNGRNDLGGARVLWNTLGSTQGKRVRWYIPAAATHYGWRSTPFICPAHG